jgi:hypothetical protein
MIALELISRLIVWADDGLRSVPGAPERLVGEHGCESTVGLLTPLDGFGVQDGRSDQRVSELQAYFVTVKKSSPDSCVEVIDEHLTLTQLRCCRQYLAQSRFTIGGGHEQSVARRRRKVAEPPGEGLFEASAQWHRVYQE